MLKKFLLLSIPLVLIGCSFFISRKQEAQPEKKLITAERKIAGDPKYNELLSEIEEILKSVREIRGLNITTPVAVGFKTIPELTVFLNQAVAEKYTDEDIKKDYYLLEKLGLIKTGTDLKKLVIELHSEQAAGFYDEASKTFYLIEEHISGDKTEFNFVVSHELVHALQDLNFNLKSITENKNDDKLMARIALIEGEAVIAAFKTLLASFGLDNVPDMSAFLNNESVYALSRKEMEGTPGFMVEEMLFPYIDGAKFVNHIFENYSSWEKFNDVYKRPPESTEQILHPEKYLIGESPVEITSHDFLNDKEWPLLEVNTLGEFSLFNFFLEYLDEATARKAASGWGGDSYAMFVKDDKNVLLALKTAWDTHEDAEDFYKAYLKTVTARYTDLKVISKTEKEFLAESSKGMIKIYFSGDKVNIAEGYGKIQEEKIEEYFNKQ